MSWGFGNENGKNLKLMPNQRYRNAVGEEVLVEVPEGHIVDKTGFGLVNYNNTINLVEYDEIIKIPKVSQRTNKTSHLSLFLSFHFSPNEPYIINVKDGERSN